MSDKHPFSLKDHGYSVIEMMVKDSAISAEHKSMGALQLLPRKFAHIILTLAGDSSLCEDTLPILQELAKGDKLKIVAPKEGQVSFELEGVKKFKTVRKAKVRILAEENINLILDKLRKLEPLKTSANKIMGMLRDPNVEFEKIEEVTSKDPGLVSRMLKTANSALYLRRNPVDNLKSAVSYLGIEGIRNIVSHELFHNFTQVFANQRDKLAHMRRCAHLATFLGKLTGAGVTELQKIQIAGLMHDVGALALAFYDTNEYARVFAETKTKSILTLDAETEVFGVDHQELGERFTLEMGMPEYISQTAGYHHETGFSYNDLVLSCVVNANGFLNEHIEQIPFTPYEGHLMQLADIINKKNLNPYKIAGVKNAQASSGEAIKFSYADFLELLKNELNNYMINSGGDAQGL